jgi:DNA-binding transcriptional MerR regulator
MVEKTQSVIPLRRAYSLLSVEDLAKAASLHPRPLEKFVGYGLIEPTVRTRSGLMFPRSSLERLRRIHRLRRDLGINLAGIAVVLDMRDRIEGLQKEVERLRGRLRLVE